MEDLKTALTNAKAWPFEEARKLIKRLERKPKDKVLFETGYGPSGLPHIGTFGEVARTSMVRHAFRALTDDKIPTQLICFSDDMDGLRKVPTNIPNQEMVAAHLGKPLTQIPDPFGTHDSFGAHNNARLQGFLDDFGFDYTFLSATQCYKSGQFDEALLKVLANYEAVMAIMLPSLGEERQQSYSPFLPVDETTGIVLQVKVLERNVATGTIVYEHPDSGKKIETPVTGGHCKLQWKPDWAMRWTSLGIDYEMAGKDLIESVALSSKICKAIGGTPPDGFNYELFLDEEGKKISKSKGNGITIEEWLRYASPESLSLFMYREPKTAKRLHFDVIPKHVDEYEQFLGGYDKQEPAQKLGNPVWHIHAGAPTSEPLPINFAMLLNLVSASNAENADTLWGFIGTYLPGVTKASHPRLNDFVEYALRYYRDFVLPSKTFRQANASERQALEDLKSTLQKLPQSASSDEIQTAIYDVGRREPYIKIMKDGSNGVALDWFNMLYQVLLGQEKGPRFGTFVALYGIANTVALIEQTLASQ